MAHFLLIHGSCHGAWCWRDVIPMLQRLGHSAQALDLPSHGQDPTPYGAVTLDDYAQAITKNLRPETYLVGHSMGGYPIAAAAERAPELIAGLIFVCAYAPRDGLSLVDMRKLADCQPLLPVMRKTSDNLGMTFDPSSHQPLFYHDCPAQALAYARENLSVQPLKPQATPIRLTERYESVTKSYIRCTNDRAIPPEYQLEMVRGWPADRVHDFPTGHSPFFADPDGLAQLMNDISKG